ncbi:MAG: sugar ABC transporter permease [Candidatus Choladocola sp.]|nr:sugar ABC transporter permease [Candidatus Choladocola sp.]
MKESKSSLLQNVIRYSLVIEMVVIFLIFQIVSKGLFLGNANVNNLFMQSCTYAIIGCSMVSVMVIGGIDLSAGMTLGFLCTFAATLQQNGIGVVIAILLTLAIGLIIGAFYGYWIAYQGMPAFIVTLAGQNVFKGLTLMVGKGMSVGPVSDTFAQFGKGCLAMIPSLIYMMCFVVIIFAVLFGTRASKVKYGFEVESITACLAKAVVLSTVVVVVGMILTMYKGIPIAVVILSVLAAILTFVGMNTPYGRGVYAIGNNRDASQLSGINARWVTFRVYLIHGLVVAVASVVYLGRIGQASATTGNGFEFSAITGCILGGTSTLGGSGTIIGAILGTVIMAGLDNGMALMNMGTTWQYLIKGVVLILAVWLDIKSKSRKK